MLRFWFNLHWIILAFFLLSGNVFAEEADFPAAPEPSASDQFHAEGIYLDTNGSELPIAYDFSDHLSDATMIIRDLRGRSLETANWGGGYFEFAQFGTKHRVGLNAGSFEGKKREAIFLYATKEHTKVLQFQKLPPKSKLVLFYGIDDSQIVAKSRQHIYVRVWIGKHMVSRLRIPHQPGWVTQEIPLGVVPFLMSPIAVTFEIATDGGEGQYFYFDAILV